MGDSLDGCDDGAAITTQRRGDNVCFSYQFVKTDNDGTVKSCREECKTIAQGTTVKLQTYDEDTTRITGGLFGQPVVAYYFGKTRTCRIEITRMDVEVHTSKFESFGSDSSSSPRFIVGSLSYIS